MQIFIRTGGSKTLTLEVEPSTTIEAVKHMIQDIVCVYAHKQRLMFDGDILYNDYTLSDNDIEHQDTIDMTHQQMGMISTFTSKPGEGRNHVEPALIDYLMLDDHDRQHTDVPLEALRTMSKFEEADPFLTFSLKADGDILSETQRGLLSDFLDFMWAIEPSPCRVDLRLALKDELFLSLVGTICGKQKAKSILSSLHQSFERVTSRSGGYGGIKVVLRMTKGPSDACIGFHCDGGYATATVQVALNGSDEYEGGRLCFFVNDTLHVLERRAGSVVQHRPRVLHGVTAMIDGTRKSLFVVDELNGLADADVVVAEKHHVNAFLAAFEAGRIFD